MVPPRLQEACQEHIPRWSPTAGRLPAMRDRCSELRLHAGWDPFEDKVQWILDRLRKSCRACPISSASGRMWLCNLVERVEVDVSLGGGSPQLGQALGFDLSGSFAGDA